MLDALRGTCPDENSGAHQIKVYAPQVLLAGEHLPTTAALLRASSGLRPSTANSINKAAWKAYGSPSTRGAPRPTAVPSPAHPNSTVPGFFGVMSGRPPKTLKMGGGFQMRPQSAPSQQPPFADPSDPYTRYGRPPSKLVTSPAATPVPKTPPTQWLPPNAPWAPTSPHSKGHGQRPASAQPMPTASTPKRSVSVYNTGEYRFEATKPVDVYGKLLWESQVRRSKAGTFDRENAATETSSPDTLPPRPMSGKRAAAASGTGSPPRVPRPVSALLPPGGPVARDRFSSSTVRTIHLLSSDYKPPVVCGFGAPNVMPAIPTPDDPRWGYTRLGRTQLQRLHKGLHAEEPANAAPSSPPQLSLGLRSKRHVGTDDDADGSVRGSGSSFSLTPKKKSLPKEKAPMRRGPRFCDDGSDEDDNNAGGKSPAAARKDASFTAGKRGKGVRLGDEDDDSESCPPVLALGGGKGKGKSKATLRLHVEGDTDSPAVTSPTAGSAMLAFKVVGDDAFSDPAPPALLKRSSSPNANSAIWQGASSRASSPTPSLPFARRPVSLPRVGSTDIDSLAGVVGSSAVFRPSSSARKHGASASGSGSEPHSRASSRPTSSARPGSGQQLGLAPGASTNQHRLDFTAILDEEIANAASEDAGGADTQYVDSSPLDVAQLAEGEGAALNLSSPQQAADDVAALPGVSLIDGMSGLGQYTQVLAGHESVGDNETLSQLHGQTQPRKQQRASGGAEDDGEAGRSSGRRFSLTQEVLGAVSDKLAAAVVDEHVDDDAYEDVSGGGDCDGVDGDAGHYSQADLDADDFSHVPRSKVSDSAGQGMPFARAPRPTSARPMAAGRPMSALPSRSGSHSGFRVNSNRPSTSNMADVAEEAEEEVLEA